VLVAGCLWWVVVWIVYLSADFGYTSIILKLFIIFSALLDLPHRFDGSVDSLKFDNTGGIELGLVFALGAVVELNIIRITNELRGQFST
jgi:hypothetical protein